MLIPDVQDKQYQRPWALNIEVYLSVDVLFYIYRPLPTSLPPTRAGQNIKITLQLFHAYLPDPLYSHCSWLHGSTNSRPNTPHAPSPQTSIRPPLLPLLNHFPFRHIFPFRCLAFDVILMFLDVGITFGVVDVFTGPDGHAALDAEVAGT